MIGWHDQHLLPLSERLTADVRCTFRQGDFFDLVARGLPSATTVGGRSTTP